MDINTHLYVMTVARDRGFDVFVKPGPPPTPVLVHRPGSDPRLATEALLNALTAWRPEVIEERAAELNGN
jgi:hypothetical protein